LTDLCGLEKELGSLPLKYCEKVGLAFFSARKDKPIENEKERFYIST